MNPCGALQRLTEVSLKLRNRDEAVQAYQKLEALWCEADPALVRVVDALRQRMLATGWLSKGSVHDSNHDR